VVKPVYLDHNATTPVDQRVVDAMLPYFTTIFGNPASIDHFHGHEARQAVEQARTQVASLVGASPEEIIFTSGATEADNIAVLGTLARAPSDAEVVVSAVEHPAVLEPAARLGARLRVVPVTAQGLIDPDEVRRLLSSRTALVSVMAANNETGALQPIEEIGAICAEAEIPFHSDAVQAAARISVSVDDAQLSLLSLSAHKLYGPKGVGALYVRRRGRRAKVAPLHYGGGHERNLRPGTANVPAIVGFGLAAKIAKESRSEETAAHQTLRSELVAALTAFGGTQLNTPLEASLPQTLNIRLAGVGARALMHKTRAELAFSSGSACATTKAEPSHVLLAQGLTAKAAGESIRLSFGRFTTSDDIAYAGEVLVRAALDLRRLNERAA
jgi:cysteine desulfurase